MKWTRQGKIFLFNKLMMLICLLSLSGTVVFAAENNGLEVKNVIRTDKVDVDLKNNTLLSNGDLKELDHSEKIKISPGSNVSMIPTVSNNGTDCYIRAFVNMDPESGLDINNLSGISENWYYNRNDGYFYCMEVLHEGDSTHLYDTLNIPVEYDKEDFDFNISVSVDAIQSDNFDPDFSNPNPWGDVSVEAYEEENVWSYVESSGENDSKSIEITFNGDSNELISNSDDFFSNLPKLVPGDSYQNTITLRNNFDKNISLYWEAHPNKGNEAQNDLLKQISLEIVDPNGNEIFNGKLSQDIENIKIIDLKPNETSQLSFKINFDKSSGNAYANIDNFVHWYFNTSFDDSVPKNMAVQTGDNAHIYGLLALSLISGALFIYSSIRLRSHKLN